MSASQFHRREDPPQPGRRTAMLAAGLGVGAVLWPRASLAQPGDVVSLPRPARGEAGSLQAALERRRSVRSYGAQPLQAAALSELLWAGQGVSNERGQRTAPSAGALYPLELHALARRVDGLPAGHYRYLPGTHALERMPAPLEADVARAAGGQASVVSAPLLLLVAAVPSRTQGRYGERAARYIAFEAGAASQNIALKAVALGLGTVVIGGFDERRLVEALRLQAGVEPVVLMPVGRPGPESAR